MKRPDLMRWLFWKKHSYNVWLDSFCLRTYHNQSTAVLGGWGWMLNVEDETPSSQSSFYESFLSNTSLFFKLFRFRRLLLERLLGRVQDSLEKSKKDNKHATRALIKQPFNWCVRWKAFVWLTHSSHMIDCINCMYYGLYLLCSLCSCLITFIRCDEKCSTVANWQSELGCLILYVARI